MNTGKISLFVLAAITSAAVAALAANPKAKTSPPPGGTNYVMNAVFSNHPPVIGDVRGIPVPSMTMLRSHRYGVTVTDGAGKISGVENVTATNLTNFGPFIKGSYIVDVSGAMSSVKSNASAMLTLKGSGYAQDALGATQAASTLNLSFASLGGIVSITNLLMPTNDIIVLSTNRSGVVSSNFYHYLLNTNIQIYPNYQMLTFVTEDSRISTNGTNITINNILHSDSYPFGPTLSTNAGPPIMPDNDPSNQFPTVVIATNINFQSSGTNISFAITNPIYGLPFSEVPGFILDYLTNNTFTNLSFPNYREVSLVSSVSSNWFAGVTFNTGYTNITVTDSLPSLSNHWYQMSGYLKGGLTAGKYKYVFNKEPALLYPRHTVYYDLFTGSGANSNLLSQFGTLAPANDLGITYIGKQCFDCCSFQGSLENYFSAKIVQFGVNQYLSADGYNGIGTIDYKNNTYKNQLKGVGWSLGSSLSMNGTVGPLVLNYYSLTNIFNLTNIAAVYNLMGANLFSLNVPLYATYTNNTLYTNFNYPELTSSFSNSLGTMAVYTFNDFYGYGYGVPIPPLLGSNVVPYGIWGVTLSGKVRGQIFPKTSGYNPSAFYPSLQYQF